MEDRISVLPDEILSYILAHLTLRDAVRMSTLSRSWKNLYLPYLDLDWRVMSGCKVPFHMKKCENYKQQFIESVDQVLQLYKDINITKFRFSFCYNKRYSTDVDKWINFAAEKDLECLKLEFICIDRKSSIIYLERDELYVICTSFLTRFRDLRNLRLDFCILKIYGDFSFKRLVKLDLNYVVLDGAQWQCFLSEASSVEWLRLRNCNLPEKFCIGYNLWSLNFLMIDSCPDVREIDINSRNLKSLEFIGEVIANFSSLNAPRLENVYVYPLEKEIYDAQYFLENLARRSSGVVTLFLEGTYSVISKLPTQSGTLFQSVLQLNLSLEEDVSNFDLEKVLPRVLKAFPLLQKFSVQLPMMINYFKRHNIPGKIQVDNFNANLKEVELGGFEPDWLFFASYLLRSCPLLDQMVINKIGKRYVGCGSWKVYVNDAWFNLRDSVQISAALKGKAVSPTARLIISDVRNCNYLTPSLSSLLDIDLNVEPSRIPFDLSSSDPSRFSNTIVTCTRHGLLRVKKEKGN
ncbi:F-box/FBD/LRR-repeat protein At1g13780-like isoform X2 [Silene latifolia]